MILHNRVNKYVLRERLQHDDTPRVTLSFYKYIKIEDTQATRDALYRDWAAMGILGRIYIAHEGINAQISLPTEQVEAFKDYLDKLSWLKNTRLNFAVDDNGKSFFKLAIKIRHKIVADGLNDAEFDAADSGVHLNAEQFNALADQPDTVIIDMRNHYESEVGHFKNALLPDVDTFREALSIAGNMLEGQEDKNVIMYCTGGIRCEKASAYFKYKGFKNVFQLEGGIIYYAQQAKKLGIENKFVGKNFVFDERLGERISEDIISHCHQCNATADTHTNCANNGCHLLFIQCENCAKQYEGCCSEECRDIKNLPENQQKLVRKGVDKGRQVYKKGRLRPRLA